MKTDHGDRTETRSSASAVYQGGMCPRCEGMGSVNDFDLTAIYDETQVALRRRAARPGLQHGRLVRPDLQRRRPAHGQAGREVHRARSCRSSCTASRRRSRSTGVNLTYEGVLTKVQKSMLSKDLEAMQPHVRRFVERAVTFTTCPDCQGTRLSKEALSSKIRGKNIAELCSMQISDLAEWLRDLDEPSVAPLLAELQHLLDSFAEIGLGYLSLDRPAGTLSGGEAQRTKMIRHLGSSLTDVTYVFDEPTIGLHPHDIARMNQLLLQLRDKGNTVLVVEHKPETIAIADHVVDLGPGAGTGGGDGRASRAPSRGCARATPSPATTSTTGPRSRRRCATPSGGARGPRRLDAQPARRRRRHPARGAVRRHRRRRVRQELARSTGRSPAATGSSSSTRARSGARGAATRRPTPACSSRSARRSPRPTASSRRSSAPTPRAPARPATAPASSTPSSASWRPSSRRARSARAGGSRRRCSSTSSAARNIAEVLAMPVAEALEFFGDGEAPHPGGPQDPRAARRRRARLPHASASR